MSGIECYWDVRDGLTRIQDLRANLTDVLRRVDDLELVIYAMKNGTDESSTMLLAQLRLGVEIEALAGIIRSDLDMAGQAAYSND